MWAEIVMDCGLRLPIARIRSGKVLEQSNCLCVVSYFRCGLSEVVDRLPDERSRLGVGRADKIQRYCPDGHCCGSLQEVPAFHLPIPPCVSKSGLGFV